MFYTSLFSMQTVLMNNNVKQTDSERTQMWCYKKGMHLCVYKDFLIAK